MCKAREEQKCLVPTTSCTGTVLIEQCQGVLVILFSVETVGSTKTISESSFFTGSDYNNTWHFHIDSCCKVLCNYNIRTVALPIIIMYLFCRCSCTQNKWNIPHYQDKLILSGLASVYLKTLQFYYLRESPTEVLSHHLYFLNTYDTAITLLK